MLILKDIQKAYLSGENTVQALKGVSISFRRNEFVSILGPSGCGKTTMLNIIGGLDRYSSGDLIVDGVSTKQYKDGDWDLYRNRSIGFVFQSYNLIPHQSVLSNVELALTLSGVSKAERRARAEEVLKKVGLSDQLHKKPNQMSGGQMQRVAIARALVNNPEILLADEPTGALDSETSVQIMDLLKEIAEDRLVIMVTHNPELAERYSTRIIRLLDGEIIDDTDPFDGAQDNEAPKKSAQPADPAAKPKRKKKKAMRYFTALSLSLNNLMTKKTRTFMTSFAGSIGIIGIALILSISSGMQAYIDRVQEETLSSYPVALEQSTMNLSSIMNTMMENNQSQAHEDDKVYSNDIMHQMLDLMVSGMTTNNLESFKQFVEDPANGFSGLTNDIQYGYDTPMYIYKADTSEGVLQINPSTLFQSLGFQMDEMTTQMASMNPMANSDIWAPLLDNAALLDAQYDVVAGRMPQADNEIVILVDKDNEITDYTLYSLGLKDANELKSVMEDLRAGKEADVDHIQQTSYTYDELLQLTFKLVVNSDFYAQEKGVWVDKREDPIFLKQVVDNAMEVKVVGILRPAPDAVATSINGSVGYLSGLMENLIGAVNESEIVKAQKASPETDIFTGKPFSDGSETPVDISTLPAEQQSYLASLPEAERQALLQQYAAEQFSAATYEGNLQKMGVADLDSPSSIQLFAKDFETKEQITDLIAQYNQKMEAAGSEENVIQYTDYVGLMMSSVSTIIDVISYILIAFVAISLIVSSIMIGIITYISVLERTKEIGILRSIGASKKDISRVFNAETLIVGFTAGIIGIGVTLLLTIPINAIINQFADVGTIAALPVAGGVILVLISMALTLIAGLIPSKIAAKKDPVEALRTE